MKYSYVFLMAILLFSCVKDEIIPEPTPGESFVNFSQLKEGQKSHFLRYSSSCSKMQEDLQFTGDTLVLEVKKEGGQWVFQENLTAHSPMYLDFSYRDTVKYQVSETSEYLLMTDRALSSLFTFYGNDTIFLNPIQKVNLVQEDCRLLLSGTPFVGEEIGYVDKFEIGPITKEAKTAVSCVPVLMDTEAYLVYDDKQLYASHSVGFASFVLGWVLVE